jgi:hypothetical protein
MGKDSSEIRREIEQTRARMGDTVEALGYKADVPSRVKEAVSDRVETVRGTISDVVEGVKDTVAGATGKVGNALGTAKRGMNDTISGTGDKVGDVTSTVTSLTDTVKSTVGSVTDKIPNTTDVKNVAQRGVGIAVENPLGLALGALAVGFLAGLTAPVTDIERRTVGPIRDDLVDRAKAAGSDAIEHGKQVLQETAAAAIGAAQQSAQQHGQQIISEAKGDATHGQTQNGGSNGGGTTTSSQFGMSLDDDTLEPGTPGTASP